MRKSWVGFIALSILLTIAAVPACAADGKDLDNYRWRVEGSWWFANPSGYFGTNGSDNYFDVSRDLHFSSYSTFAGTVDYRFARKHHFLLNISPNTSTHTAILSRTIEFQGQTFDIGAQVKGSLRSINIAPGYQYDLIRRDHGFLGIEADFNLLDTEGKLELVTSVNEQQRTRSASKSIFTVIPAIGPAGRWYPLHDSNRLVLDGSVRGMYLFGYGDFITARGNVGVGLTKGLALRAGYELGSRLSVHGTADQIALRVTQKGPTAGLEYSWGEAPAQKVKTAGPAVPSDWHVEWIPFYLWFSGLSGNVGAKGYVVPVHVTFADVFSQLNIGLMSVLDVRHKEIGSLTDLVFISLSTDQKATPVGTVASGFTANAKTFFLDEQTYGRVVDSKRGSVDVTAGARIWHLDNSIDLFQGESQVVSTGQSQGWVDPVLGGRFRVSLDKGWFANLKGDAGGFGIGSQVTWQIYTGIGKEIKNKYSLLLGYRYLDVDYQNGGFLYDTHMSGLLAGFGIRFK